ncbi:TIGR03943 family putative permease subunit [Microbacterium arborescens]
MPKSSALLTRLFGVGLAAALAAITVTLAVTGRIGLYINPESAWFAVGMSVLGLVGTVVSFALPLGAEADHGHDHGELHGHGLAHSHEREHEHAHAHAAAAHEHENPDHDRPHAAPSAPPDALPTAVPTAAPTSRRAARAAALSGDTTALSGDTAAPGAAVAPVRPRPDWRLVLGSAAAGTGGLLATGIVAVALVTPPATLSAELAMSRDTGTPPLFQGADTVALATTGDTSSFGVGEWASVFATATNPEAFEGDEISLTGFVTPSSSGGFGLTRLVITHCVIDAQPASIPIGESSDIPATGEWVTVTGVIRDRDGTLVVEATGVQTVDEPEDPYEY